MPSRIQAEILARWSMIQREDRQVLLRVLAMRASWALDSELQDSLGEDRSRTWTGLLEVISGGKSRLSADAARALILDAEDLVNELPTDGFGAVGLVVRLVYRTVLEVLDPNETQFGDAVEDWVSLADEWFSDRRAPRSDAARMNADLEVGEALQTLQAYALLLDLEWLVQLRMDTGAGPIDVAAITRRARRFSVASAGLVGLL